LLQVGENITVIGKIYSIKELGNIKIINFNSYNKQDKLQSFKAVIKRNQLNSGLIQFNPVIDLDTLISWVGKFVIVSGKVEIYNHPTNGTFHPQIILVDSSQIEKIKAKDANNLLYSTVDNNQTNIHDQSQQKSSNPPVTPVKVSTSPQQSSSSQNTYSYTYVKPNAPSFQAQPAPKVTPIITTKQSSPTQSTYSSANVKQSSPSFQAQPASKTTPITTTKQSSLTKNQNSQNTRSNQSNSTSNSNGLFGCLGFLIVIILTLFMVIKLGIGWGIMALLITSFICLSISSYLDGDLENFKNNISLFVLPLSFMTGITWFYGIGWGILGLIISFILSAIIFS